MWNKILSFVISVILVIAPIQGVQVLLQKFSSVTNQNLTTYILACVIYTLASGIILYFVLNKNLPKALLLGGAFLFLGGAIATAAIALREPDMSQTVLQNTIRDHFRYLILFLLTITTCYAFFKILKPLWNELPNIHKWIVPIFILAAIGFFYEFIHQYFYSDNLKKWIDIGKNVADFNSNYFDNFNTKTFGLGRIFQYLCIGWLGLILVRFNRLKKWSFGILAFLCTIGVLIGVRLSWVDAEAIFKGEVFPKGWEILNLFVLPAAPFMFLYWTSIALLSKKTKSE